MASLSSKASSFHCIRFLVQQIFAQSSRTFERMYLRPTKAAWLSTLKVRHSKPIHHRQKVLPSRLARASVVGSNLKSAGYHPGLPRAAKVMNVLISCGCTKSCTGRRFCYKKGIVCTARCRCPGHCYRRSNPHPTPSSE